MPTPLPLPPIPLTAVADDVLRAALSPWTEACHYVRRAATARDPQGNLWLQAGLAIDAPYYIDDTGHFNSVEFNLCTEQLAAVLATDTGALGAIARIESIFVRPLNPRGFEGTLMLTPGAPALATGDDSQPKAVRGQVWYGNGGHTACAGHLVWGDVAADGVPTAAPS